MPAKTKARASSAEDADMEDVAPTSAQQLASSQEGDDPMEEDGGNELADEEEVEEPQRIRIVSLTILVFCVNIDRINSGYIPASRIYKHSGIL